MPNTDDRELEACARFMPNGWAGLLHFYGLRSMPALATMRDVIASAYMAIADEDAARCEVPVGDALDALLAPGTHTIVSGARAELLDLFGLVVSRSGREGSILVVCGSEPPAVVARRWLHARARVPRSAPVSREGWVRLTTEAGAMAALDVSFLSGSLDPASTGDAWRSVLDLSAVSGSVSEHLGDAVAAGVVVLSTRCRPPPSARWRQACLERRADTVRVLRLRAGAEERVTELYYEASSGFMARLAPEDWGRAAEAHG